MNDKLRRFTVVPMRPANEAAQGDDTARMRSGLGEEPTVPTVVVIAPPGSDLDHAFALARTALERSDSVRLVGHGAIFSHGWPQWVHSTPGLTISELGGYWSRPNAELVLPLLEPIRRWIDEVFAGAVDGARGRDVFYAQTCHRLVQHYIDAYPAAQGLYAAHPNAAFICAMPSWVGVEILHALGASVTPKPTTAAAATSLDGVRVFAAGAAALPLAMGKLLGSWVRGRDSRRELRRLRSMWRAKARQTPKRWAAVYADWPRLSRHTLEAVGLDGKSANTDTGILFVQTLARGLRIEDGPLRTTGQELWPTATPLREIDPEIVIEQAVLPEPVSELVWALLIGTRSSMQAIWRASRRPRLDLGVLSVSLGAHATGFAKLATLDVLRAIAAGRAAAAVGQRWPLANSVVAFSLANTSELAAVDIALQAAGATTIELTHGTAEDCWVGQSETPSSIWSVWTRPDMRTIEALGRRVIVAGMPTPPRQAPSGARRDDAQPVTRNPNAKTRVLFLSNYLHRDGVDARFPNELHLDELVDVAARLRNAEPHSLTIHWRPHPREDIPSLRRKLRRAVPGVTISEPLRTPLSTDLADADVIVASVSTSMVEALVAGLPVFVHVAARVSGLPATSSFHESRQFFFASEGTKKIVDYLHQLRAGEDVSVPEAHALHELFGPTRWPTSLLSVLASGEPVTPTNRIPRQRASVLVASTLLDPHKTQS